MSILAAVLTAPLATAVPPAGAELEEALSVLAHLDEVIVSVEFRGTDLAEAIGTLAARSEVPLRVDWDALDFYGIAPDDPVTLELHSVRLSTALAALCMELGDDFERPVVESTPGLLVMTTRDAAASLALTDVYDVRDLLAGDAVLDHLLETAPPVEPGGAAPAGDAEADAGDASGAQRKGDHEDDDDDDDQGDGDLPVGGRLPPLDVGRPGGPATPRTRSEKLMWLVVEHIDTDAWRDVGGDRASYTDRDGVVVISAPPSMHRRIRDLFARLRQAYFTSLSIEAGIVDVPRADLDRLTRRSDRSSAVLARTLLARPDGAVLWRGAMAVALGQHGTVETQATGVTVELTLEPTFDRATGILNLEVDAKSQHGDDRRHVETTVTIPFRDGGAVIELPAASAGEAVRLLVLVPTRM